MKGILEEYGRFAITGIIILILISFVLSNTNGGFLNSLKKYSEISGTTVVKTDNNSDLLKVYSKQLAPTFTVEPQKLVAGQPYDLLSNVFVKDMKRRVLDINGNLEVSTMTDPYELSITKITGKNGEELSLSEVAPDGRTVTLPRLTREEGEPITLETYLITYKLTDKNTESYPVSTTQTYRFVVD